MATISVCMIVKNEEQVLARCLDSLNGLYEELIIVDTGSTDKTKEIALRYTDKVYDFAWTGNFSDARNFSFSKASEEYIYSADADEVIDEENREKFRLLKEAIIPEIEIVQMYYGNQLSQKSIYNYDLEYRPKLYKRIRTFIWEEPIHEAVRLSPLVYDSDIVITHLPTGEHGERDLLAFEQMLENGEMISERLRDIYLRELYFIQRQEHLKKAEPYLISLLEEHDPYSDTYQRSVALLMLLANMQKDESDRLKYSLKAAATAGSSEGCLELGKYFYEKKDYEEAVLWFYNAAFETKPLLCLNAGEKEPLSYLVDCYDRLGVEGMALEYKNKLASLLGDS